MSNNVIDKMEAEVNSIMEANEQLINDESAELAAMDEAILATEKEIDEAFIAGDHAAYKKAQEKLDKQKFDKQFKEGHLQKLRESHLISEEDYNEKCVQLLAYIKEEVDTSLKEALAYIGECSTKADVVSDDIETVNRILHDLQRNVYREDIRLKNSKGEYSKNSSGDYVEDPSKIKAFADWTYVQLIRIYTDNSLYKDIIKEMED